MIKRPSWARWEGYVGQYRVWFKYKPSATRRLDLVSCDVPGRIIPKDRWTTNHPGFRITRLRKISR